MDMLTSGKGRSFNLKSHQSHCLFSEGHGLPQSHFSKSLGGGAAGAAEMMP